MQTETRARIESNAIMMEGYEEILSGMAVAIKEMVDNGEVKGHSAMKLKGMYHTLVWIQDELGAITGTLEEMLGSGEKAA